MQYKNNLCARVSSCSRTFPIGQGKRHSDKRGDLHEARSGRKGGAGYAAASPFGRIAAIGGEARGSAHGSYPRSGNCQSGSHAFIKRVTFPLDRRYTPK